MSELVGRREHLDVAGKAIERVVAGGFAAVVVQGDPGTGKTVLLDEVARRAGAAGLAVFRAQATGPAHDVPFEVFTEALHPLSREPFHGTRASLLPLLRRGFERAGTVALLLDDLHRADRDSAGLTEYLIHRPPRVPTLMVLAFRLGRVPVAVRDALARHGNGVAWIGVGPLAGGELHALLPADGERRRRLFRASGGNPRFAHVLAGCTGRTLAALADSIGDIDPVDRTALAGLAAEITTLDEPSQRLAYATAVLGDTAPVDLVARVAQVPRGEMLDRLVRLCGSGLLALDGDRLSYWHPLVRVAARELAGPVWRLAASQIPARQPSVHYGLTSREEQIVDLVGAGLRNHEIAVTLCLSRRTVESHLARIYTKLDVRSRTGMLSRLSAAGRSA